MERVLFDGDQVLVDQQPVRLGEGGDHHVDAIEVGERLRHGEEHGGGRRAGRRMDGGEKTWTEGEVLERQQDALALSWRLDDGDFSWQANLRHDQDSAFGGINSFFSRCVNSLANVDLPLPLAPSSAMRSSLSIRSVSRERTGFSGS